MTYRDIASCDHLDLSVSASIRYGLLASATTAAFSGASQYAGTVATPHRGGAAAARGDLAPARRRTNRGRALLRLDGDDGRYAHRPAASSRSK